LCGCDQPFTDWQYGAFMTRPLTSATLCLAALALAGSAAGWVSADDLFSSIKIDTVFTPPAATSTPTPSRPDEKSERIQRVLNITQLTDILRDAGLEPEADEATVLVKLQQSRWTFPIVLGLDEQREQIVMIVRLADFTGKSALASERLLALLGASRELRPAFFSYSEKNKRVELMMGIDNDAISPRLLREELRRLAQMAENTAGLWEVSAASNNVAAAPATPATGSKPAGQNLTINTNTNRPNNAAPAAAAGSLVGKWSAARSAKEAFAIQLNADNTFVLVYVKDGKQSRSSGQFALAGGQLTLTGSDGTKFSGSISGVTAKTFEFTPPNTAKLTFQKAA
jgi:hypothetical protein